MTENPQQFWSDYDSNSSRLGSAASFFGDSASHSSGILTENSSLFSMSEDDFDHLATLKAKEMFDEVDRILYENLEHASLQMTTECQEWKAKFPHLRIVGHKMIDSTDQGFKRYSPADAAYNAIDSKMAALARCKDISSLINGLSLRGERLNARPLSNYVIDGEEEEEEEEDAFQDGDYEEIFALDYNSEEKRRTRGLSRGYPPITPINSIRDCVVSSLCNKVLCDVSTHVLELVVKCKSKQTIIPSKERPKGKENVKVNNLSDVKITESLVPLKPPSSPSGVRTLDDPPCNGHHVTSRSFSFKPSDLQAVPEDSRLDAILTVRQMRSARDGDLSPFSTPSLHHLHHHHHHHHLPNPDPVGCCSSRSGDNQKSKSSLLSLSEVFQSPRTSKSISNGKTLQNSRLEQQQPRQQLPRIQQKPLTASNNNVDRVKQLANAMFSKTTKDRMKSLPFLNDGKTKHRQIPGTSPTESLPRVEIIKSEKVTRNFVLENIRNISSSRKASRLQETAVSCPNLSRKVFSGSDVMSRHGKESCHVLPKTTCRKMSRQVKFNLDDSVRFSQRGEFCGGPLLRRNQSSRSLHSPMIQVKTCEASNKSSKNNKDMRVLNCKVKTSKREKEESAKEDAMDVFDGLKFASEEALKVCLDLKASCECLRKICDLLKEVCIVLKEEKH